MATQIVQIDRRDPITAIPIRNNATAVFILVTDDGRPAAIRRVARPPTGVLSAESIAGIVESAGPPSLAPSTPTTGPVSVIVCTHERPTDLDRCLASLAAVHEPSHEVVVVDNAPTTDQTAAIVRRFGARYVLEPEKGLDRARNAGLAAAAHALVAFVDDDVVVTRQWLAALCAPFADATVAGTAGLVLPLELETPAQEEFELYSSHWRRLQRTVYSREVLRPSTAGIVGVGANMAFRKTIVQSLGGFDPRLDAGTRICSGGDTDMFARLIDAGQRLVYSPDALVWHRHRRTEDELRACIFGYSIGTYGWLTKRLTEQRDLGALVTAALWFAGPVVKTAVAKSMGRPAIRWATVFLGTAGAAVGPVSFVREAWRHAGAASYGNS